MLSERVCGDLISILDLRRLFGRVIWNRKKWDDLVEFDNSENFGFLEFWNIGLFSWLLLNDFI